MKKEFKCFFTDTRFVLPDTHQVSEVFELSVIGRTFSKRVEERKLPNDENHIIFSFNHDDSNKMSDTDLKNIILIMTGFFDIVKELATDSKNEIISTFMSYHNGKGGDLLSSFDYNSIIEHPKGRYPDYVSFETESMVASIWCSNNSFMLFYPLYDNQSVWPFSNFPDIVRNSSQMTEALANVQYTDLIDRINAGNEGYPPTTFKLLNIPYYPVEGANPITCNFGFNIWGKDGAYDHNLKETLLTDLKDLGLTDEFIEIHFPDIYKVNEFYMTPEWARLAIPSKTGQGSVNSQVTKSFDEVNNLAHFLKVYRDAPDHLRKETYDVPYAYNNILIRVTNGRFTDVANRDFIKLYPDIVTSPTTHGVFGTMKKETQELLIMWNYLFDIADVLDQTTAIGKIMSTNNSTADRNYQFALGVRGGVTYITAVFRSHRYYIVPRFEYTRITNEEINI